MPGATPFHHSGWLAALERENGQRPLKLACEEPDGTLSGILPLMATSGLPFGVGGPSAGRRLSSLPRTPVAGPLGTDRTVLRALLAELPAHNHARHRDAELAAVRQAFNERLARQEPPMSFLRAIRAALPDDGIYVEEVTQVGFASRLAFPVHTPRTFLSPGYQDTLGWGYGTALGAQAASPGRKVALATGDGGFMFQSAELATAMRHNLPVVVVVFDDGAFGNVRRIQEQQYGNRLIACDLANPDFVKFAESFGMAAFHAASPDELEVALHHAFALNAPALVRVPVGPMPSPWDMILLPRVRGFADAWRPALP